MKGTRHKILLPAFVILNFLTTPLFGQLQASYWATLGGQLIDVSVHPPRDVGINNRGQWWSTIADDQGKFLFYTDGSLFYNKANKLIGNSGVEHSYLDGDVCILPYPGKPNVYYSFYIGFTNNDITKAEYLYSTVVDLSKGNQVASPRQALTRVNSGNHEVIATRTSNCQSYWLVIGDADTLKSYYVDRNGVRPTPAKTKVDFISFPLLKFSSDGNTAALIETGRDTVYLDVLDFNKATGLFKSKYRQPLKKWGYDFDYQIEFSPNSNNLFLLIDSLYNDPDPLIGGLTNYEIWVYNSKATTLDKFSNTRILLYSEKKVTLTFSGIQLTPTGRIYLTCKGDGKVLSCINNPNAEKKEDFGFEPKLSLPFVANFIQPPIFPSYFFQNLNYPTAVVPAFAGRDTLLCRGQNIVIGDSSESGHTYDWRSDGNLNKTNVSDPTLISPVTPRITYDTIYNYLTVYDSVCRQGMDTVKVIYKPARSAIINGSKSVCPGVKDVTYWVNGITNDQFDWEIYGGQLSQNFSDSITVNWSVTNFSAQVKLTAINAYGCPDLVDPFPVKIYKYLDTETPSGVDTLQCAKNTYRYMIQSTNGSVYNWNVLNGQLIQGNGTNAVTVAWDLSKKYGSLWIDESVNTQLESCFGRSDTLHLVNPAAFGSENIFLYAISSVLDEPKKVNLNYEIKNPVFFQPTAAVFWKSQTDPNWNAPFTISSDTSTYQLDLDEPLQSEYLFQIKARNICNTEVTSSVNSNILLKLNKDSVNETIYLTWNKPAGWGHVDSFDLYRKKDSDNYLSFANLSGDSLQKEILTTLDGFQFSYYITGHSIESPFPSTSNEKEVSFEHIPVIPNVITPNDDQINDYFVIEKLNLYPENHLTIFNRYGETVYEKVNYQNTWNGSNLSSGIYFYYFKTPKFSRTFKGWLQIIR